MSWRAISAGCLLSIFVAGCTTPTRPATTVTQPVDTTTTTSDPSVASTDTTVTAGPVEPRWVEVSGALFIDTRTGEEFVPLGVNLLRKLGGGGGDRMFANYDPLWVEEQLDGITSLGFNTVRFFLDMCMECTATSEGLREDYLDNLADLLTRLEDHGLVALPTSNDVPDPGFSERLPCCEPFGGYRNSLYLSPDGHEIAVKYWTALLAGLEARGAPTHHVLGWQLANEQFVLRDVPPLSLTEGDLVAADGRTYDMGDDVEVAEMVVSSLRSYISTVGDAIRASDEGALITMGFFSADDPDAGRVASDNRWVVPQSILDDSTLDFVDLHAYPGLGGTWASIGPAYGLHDRTVGYPLLLGEFGAFEDAYPSHDEAAAAMARFQAESCEWGFGGWLLWFWGATEDDEVITVESHDAAIARAISARVRPDPCLVGPYESSNLALGRTATASAVESDEYSAMRVTDGSDATWWSAAAGAPQWVEIDLGEARSVGRVEILIGHVSPPGPQTHRVFVRAEGETGNGAFVGEVSADAVQGEWLSVEFSAVSGVRHVRVETLAVDGWVIIHEVTVHSD